VSVKRIYLLLHKPSHNVLDECDTHEAAEAELQIWLEADPSNRREDFEITTLVVPT
jgi:hypothetical protein